MGEFTTHTLPWGLVSGLDSHHHINDKDTGIGVPNKIQKRFTCDSDLDSAMSEVKIW